MASVANDDPLLSWLRSLRQVKQAHAEDKSKILPYVSDCYKEFCNSARYRNDPRFLRVCVQLADCSPDPLQIMAELDERGIGQTHALFYEAYATCLEAKRRFGDANNVYKRGLASQAQPTEKLINSYTIFRERMDTRKKRKQEQVEQHARKSCSAAEQALPRHNDLDDNRIKHMEACQGGAELATRSHLIAKNLYKDEGVDISFEELRLSSACKNITSSREPYLANTASTLKPVSSQRICKLDSGSFGDETIQINNFAAEVVTGKEKDVEDARHHGLVDPTINTKEALQDILSMFCKPLDFAKREKSKPTKRVDYKSVPASPPLLDQKWQLTSPEVVKQTPKFEFSVYKDNEQSEPHAKTGGKPVAAFPLLCDENKATRSPLGSLQAQPLELCLFKDEEEEQLQPPQRSSAGLCLEGKRQSNPLLDNENKATRSPLGSVHAQPLELFVFKDEEEQHQPSPQRASAGRCLEGKRKSNLLLDSLQRRPLEFSVFKDDESEEKQAEQRTKLADKENKVNKIIYH
ncbi:hypothetical protein L7F22_029031 [Adiantum nelumboides]|nr:hypothetical protein [Adiantum nelumboides]